MEYIFLIEKLHRAIKKGEKRKEGVKLRCKKCRSEIDKSANFCKFCGTKQNSICNCWIKKEPYNCGQEKCPGYKLFNLERSEKATS